MPHPAAFLLAIAGTLALAASAGAEPELRPPVGVAPHHGPLEVAETLELHQVRLVADPSPEQPLGFHSCTNGDAPAKLPDDLERIEAQLVERAGQLLDRYGTTFYALAAYVDAEQQMREVVPERAAPLQPEAIAQALREAFARIPRSRVLAAGLILELPDEPKVRMQLEVVAGVCCRLTRSYSFGPDGRVAFGDASTATCASRLLPDG